VVWVYTLPEGEKVKTVVHEAVTSANLLETKDTNEKVVHTLSLIARIDMGRGD